MKTIIATVAAAAVITAGASVAGAQELGGSTGGVSPYVDFEYVSRPTAESAAGAGDATWWGGDATSTVTLGAEATLPWDLTMDASVGIVNDTNVIGHGAVAAGGTDDSAIDFGGFALAGADITIGYEVMDGMTVYSTTAFDSDFNRESTSVGMSWKF